LTPHDTEDVTELTWKLGCAKDVDTVETPMDYVENPLVETIEIPWKIIEMLRFGVIFWVSVKFRVVSLEL